MKSLVFGLLVFVVTLLGLTSIAKADPFDDFVGHYTPASISSYAVKVQSCNRFDFQEMASFDVRADRTGFRQTHQLRINVPNGYSSIAVVPTYREPSSLDPSFGNFGSSDGDANKAVTVHGSFGKNKNEIVTVTMTKVDEKYKLEIDNEVKTDTNDVLEGCYYSAVLVKSTDAP